MSIQSLLQPDCVALIGASADPRKPSGMLLSFLERSGFPGEFYCVNPSRTTISSHPSYPSLAELPQVPQTAVVAVPSTEAVAAIAECAEAGVGSVVVLTGGFGEGGGGGPDGHARARELDEIRRRTSIRLLGPNTVGMVNFERSLPLTFADWYGRDTGLRGSTAVVTASGSVGGLLFQSLQAEGVGVNYWIGLGNEQDLEVCDFVDHFTESESIKCVVAFIEGVRDGTRFLSSVRALRDAGKNIVVAKAGRSEAGQRSTKSHTGKVSSSAEVYRDVLRQLGAIEVGSIREAAYVTRALEASPEGYPTDVGLISASGGLCSLMTDQAVASDLRVGQLPEPIKRRLSTVIPPYGSHDNPVDTSADAIHKGEIFTGTLDAVADEQTPRTWIVTGRAILDRYADELAERAAMLQQKIVACPGIRMEADTERVLTNAGIPVLTDTDTCLAALGRIAASADRDRDADLSKTTRRRTLSDRSAAPELVHNALRAAGLPVAPSAFARTADEARRLVEEQSIGYPVAVKVAVAEITHKSEAGGVLLGVEDAGQLAAAIDRIGSSVTATTGLGDLSYEVQQMVDPGTELLLSVASDADFGPVALIGLGGVEVEISPDVVHCAAPASPSWYRTMVESLRGARLLDGFRGRAPVAVDELAGLLGALVDFYLDNPWVAEIELNPVIASHTDGRLSVVDALVTCALDEVPR